MDIVTHGLASLAVARGLFPRSPRQSAVFAILTGTLADLDWLSVYRGPTAYLNWHETYFHSVLVPIVLVSILPVFLLAIFLVRGSAGIYVSFPRGQELPSEPRARVRLVWRSFFGAIVGAPLCAALLHVAMDACQSDGVMLLWPFSSRRFALDWLPDLDPWILAILILCIAVPELLRLVSSEIGAKSKKPRGQTGALLGLALIVVYAGVRATLHSNVVAALESRTFHGEPARRASAFPESLSLLTWHGVAETENALNEIEVNAREASTLDADTSLQLFKPQSSRALDAARNTAVVKKFLAAARIPKASVEKTETGYVVVLRDLRYALSRETGHEVAALIILDSDSKVTSQELVWVGAARKADSSLRSE